MNLHNAEKEEERIALAIEKGEDPEAPFPNYQTQGDWLTDFIDTLNTDTSGEDEVETVTSFSLFPNDLGFAREACAQLGDDANGFQQSEWLDHLDGFRLNAPDDLQHRFSYLPPELKRKGWEFKLTTDRQRVMDALADAHQTEERWPEWELFWPLHPIAEWLNDRVLAMFNRHEAPVIAVQQGLEPGEVAYCIQGVVSNLRSQPVLVDWFAVVSQPGRDQLEVLDLEALLERAGLADGSLSNLGEEPSRRLSEGLDAIIGRARQHVRRLVEARKTELAKTLQPANQALEQWAAKAKQRLSGEEKRYERSTQAQQRRWQSERAHIDRLLAERKQWIQQGVNVSPHPYLRLACVLRAR